MRLALLLAGAAALTAFQNPPGPDGRPRPTPSPTVTPSPTPGPDGEPRPSPSVSTTPTPTPSPTATPSDAPTPPINDQSPEAKNSGDSGEVQGDDQPPKQPTG